MNAVDFGRLVAALRREHPDDGPGSGHWTQRRLGIESGLGVHIIGDIEIGERRNLDANTILALANALKLTSRERKEFFYAASGVEEEAAARPVQDAAKVLEDQMDILGTLQLPCFLVDNYGDIVVANGAVAELFAVSPDTIQNSRGFLVGFNVMRIIFDKKDLSFRTAMGSDWPRYARHNMQSFRALSLRFRHKGRFRRTLEALMKLPDFRAFWLSACEDDEDHYSTSLHYHYFHPRFGPLSYYTASSMSVTSHGELSLTVYSPGTPETSEVFGYLVKERDLVLRLAEWPKE